MYAEQWEEYRKRRLMYLIFFLGSPTPFIVMVLLSQVFHDEFARNVEIVDRAYFTMYGLWGIVLCWSWIRLIYWRCPHCDNYYFARLTSNPFAQRCLHCGLKKWDQGEEEKDERFFQMKP